MAVAQCRVCALCGMDMSGPIEADHIIPFSLGGKTDMSNGQATCASCNRKKSNTMQDIYIPKSFKLRTWQLECLQAFEHKVGKSMLHPVDAEPMSFCLHAAPGAGKTKLAACAFKTAQQMGIADKLLWVVPSSSLKTDIADRDRSKDLWAEGITAVHDIPNALVEESIAYGRSVWPQNKDAWLVTYSQLASNPQLFAALCSNFKVMAVLDEVHHVRDGKCWGNSIRLALERSKLVMPMSGTLFTSDGGEIPFVDYEDRIDDDGKTVRTYKTDYSFGIDDGLRCWDGEATPSIRPLTYVRVDASGKIKYRNIQSGEEFTKIVDLKEEGAKLTPLLAPRSEMVRVMLKAGIDSLDEYRDVEGDQTAGGLIVCMNKEHAMAIAELMRNQFGEDPLVVLHDTNGASEAIDQFRRGNRRWIVTVRMVSEGVDIRRLRVGVYLTNYITYLFLVQWLGRMWRWNPALGSTQQGTAIVPGQSDIMEWVANLETMTHESIVKNIPEEDASGDGTSPQRLVHAVVHSQITSKVASGLLRGIGFGADSYTEAQAVYRELNGTVPTGTIALVLEAQAKRQSVICPAVTEDIQRESDSLALGNLIGAIRREMRGNPPEDWDGGNPYQYINGKLNKATGVKSYSEKMATDEDVKARKEAARKMLGALRNA